MTSLGLEDPLGGGEDCEIGSWEEPGFRVLRRKESSCWIEVKVLDKDRVDWSDTRSGKAVFKSGPTQRKNKSKEKQIDNFNTNFHYMEHILQNCT